MRKPMILNSSRSKATKQSRASIPSIFLARPPQPYGAENSHEKVQNVVTDCTALRDQVNHFVRCSV